MNDDTTSDKAADAPKRTFSSKCVRLDLAQLIALKPVKPEIKRAVKYR